MSPRDDATSRLAFAVDVPSANEARPWIEQLAGSVGVFKLGLELFCHEGPTFVREVTKQNHKVFLDLKLHDIPATVGRSIARLGDLGVSYLTVHAAGGAPMLEAAQREADRYKMTLLAVTVLTSLGADDLTHMGLGNSTSELAISLAKNARSVGVRGFVCSPEELVAMRRDVGDDLVLVTPGIRPAGGDHGDQKRVATPKLAIEQGASLLVVGRPIRDAKDPKNTASAIVDDIEAAMRSGARS